MKDASIDCHVDKSERRYPIINDSYRYMFYWNRKMAETTTDVHLNPIKILHAVEELMSGDSIIVADGGDFVGTAAYILR